MEEFIQNFKALVWIGFELSRNNLARNHNLRKLELFIRQIIYASSVHHQLAYDIENQYYVLIKHVPE